MNFANYYYLSAISWFYNKKFTFFLKISYYFLFSFEFENRNFRRKIYDLEFLNFEFQFRKFLDPALIQEEALVLLKSLANKHSAEVFAKWQILGIDQHKYILLAKLRQCRHQPAVLRRTLQVPVNPFPSNPRCQKIAYFYDQNYCWTIGHWFTHLFLIYL